MDPSDRISFSSWQHCMQMAGVCIHIRHSHRDLSTFMGVVARRANKLRDNGVAELVDYCWFPSLCRRETQVPIVIAHAEASWLTPSCRKVIELLPNSFQGGCPGYLCLCPFHSGGFLWKTRKIFSLISPDSCDSLCPQLHTVSEDILRSSCY